MLDQGWRSYGGVSRGLSVIWTLDELWFRVSPLFRGIAFIYDIEQRIPHAAIRAVESRGRTVTLSFESDGEPLRYQLRLTTRQVAEFVQLVEQVLRESG